MCRENEYDRYVPHDSISHCHSYFFQTALDMMGTHIILSKRISKLGVDVAVTSELLTILLTTLHRFVQLPSKQRDESSI